MYAVNPGKDADYEQIIAKLREALGKSTAPEAKQQLEGWKVVKSQKSLTNDTSSTYIHINSPVVKGADYSIVNIVYGVSTDDEKRAFYELYKGALKGALSQITANDPGTALELAGGEPRPDLVLLDIDMPGATGFELITLLKEDGKTAHIPVVFLTARDTPRDQTEAFQLGASDYNTKPINASTNAASRATLKSCAPAQAAITASKMRSRGKLPSLCESSKAAPMPSIINIGTNAGTLSIMPSSSGKWGSASAESAPP